MVIAVDIVGGQCNRCTMYRIPRSFFKFSIPTSEQNHDFVAARTCQGDIGVPVLIEVAHHERTWFLTDMQLNLISECTVTVPKQNRKGITRNIGGDEIGERVMIKISGHHSSW